MGDCLLFFGGGGEVSRPTIFPILLLTLLLRLKPLGLLSKILCALLVELSTVFNLCPCHPF